MTHHRKFALHVWSIKMLALYFLAVGLPAIAVERSEAPPQSPYSRVNL